MNNLLNIYNKTSEQQLLGLFQKPIQMKNSINLTEFPTNIKLKITHSATAYIQNT